MDIVSNILSITRTTSNPQRYYPGISNHARKNQKQRIREKIKKRGVRRKRGERRKGENLMSRYLQDIR